MFNFILDGIKFIMQCIKYLLDRISFYTNNYVPALKSILVLGIAFAIVFFTIKAAKSLIWGS